LAIPPTTPVTLPPPPLGLPPPVAAAAGFPLQVIMVERRFKWAEIQAKDLLPRRWPAQMKSLCPPTTAAVTPAVCFRFQTTQGWW
jgi:hypothetical protein